jgi:hypothetical protein
MAKFMVIYHAPASATEAMANVTPEQMAEGMKPWMAWAERCGPALVDMGNPLAGGQTVTKSGTKASGRQVAGYSVLEAADMAAALKLVEGHPHLEWADGCEIEVHEEMPMPGM